MKTLIQKISLLVVTVIAGMTINAQVIEVSATVNTPFGPLTQVIANASTFDATFNGAVSDFKSYFPVTVTIKNTATSGPALQLTQTAGKYITIGGSGASDFIITESALTGNIAAGSSQTFTVDLSPSATNGTDKVVSLSISSNSTSNSTAGVYSGSIKYSLTSVVTSLTKASEIGLSLYPNPSNDGKMHVSAENTAVERIVVSNVAGQTEEFASNEFTTSLKGLLLVRLYTDKGVISEKIIIQE